MRARPWLLIVVLLAVVVLTSAAVWVAVPAPDRNETSATPRSPTSAPTSTVSAVTAASAAAECGPPATRAVTSPIVVSLPPGRPFTVGAIAASSWRQPAVADVSWQLQFSGFMYMAPLAARAQRDGSKAVLAALVGQVAAFHVQNPDVGSSADGWDEGTAQRRLQTENCLYALTKDRRLAAGMIADANVQLGSRYAGPPLHVVHNHGLMANLQLLRAGQLLGVDAWVATAARRLKAEAPLAFSASGTTWEQSSQYQGVNVYLWRRAADMVAALPGHSDAAAAIRAVTVRAAIVRQWLTEPDGDTVQIGDADRLPGATGAQSGLVFRDDLAGFVVSRSSWTDRAATFYTLRYGPPRRAHGHEDRGGVTWSTRGARVLVGAGRFGYDLRSSFAQWARSAASANVAVPDGAAIDTAARVRIERISAGPQTTRWRLNDRLYGTDHVRTVDISDAAATLRVSDTYAGGVTFRQHWHLDPTWRLVSAPASGQSMVFRDAGGRVLRITTTGRLALLLKGSRAPIAGWHANVLGSPVPSYEIVLRSKGPTLTTTFTVR
ncbi:MAG: hypothetical protein QOC60_372 [Frankiaceae bacterium]|nr:hypothetical protein [Frankiaceae bacterium]